ncbi:hypothetical protein PR202_gb20292 [Eleusine coracana subsp. coracana]|uniref:Uncharacterized protein n=1 Tax=Eleusine coracana subsp. coracana TaxID=191504 RepID=A0AAV5F856_ELECO|nr:hypothetical protein PR202_gb20292 [Eleusine coracana subsp. coracana]
MRLSVSSTAGGMTSGMHQRQPLVDLSRGSPPYAVVPVAAAVLERGKPATMSLMMSVLLQWFVNPRRRAEVRRPGHQGGAQESPTEVVHAHIQHLKRSMDLSMKHEYLKTSRFNNDVRNKVAAKDQHIADMQKKAEPDCEDIINIVDGMYTKDDISLEDVLRIVNTFLKARFLFHHKHHFHFSVR